MTLRSGVGAIRQICRQESDGIVTGDVTRVCDSGHHTSEPPKSASDLRSHSPRTTASRPHPTSCAAIAHQHDISQNGAVQLANSEVEPQKKGEPEWTRPLF